MSQLSLRCFSKNWLERIQLKTNETVVEIHEEYKMYVK